MHQHVFEWILWSMNRGYMTALQAALYVAHIDG